MDYKNKYLKYKIKYLKLKNQTGGTKFIITDHSCNEDNRERFIDFVRSNGSFIINSYHMYYFIELNIKDIDYNVVVAIKDNEIILYFLNNLCSLDKILKELERLTELDNEKIKKIERGEIDFDIDFDINFDENKNRITGFIASQSFIQLFFSKNDTITTNLDFNLIDKENKLGTIMKLLDILYMYFCHKKIELSDMAQFKCPNLATDELQLEYNANIYRIFATDKTINDISIYCKYDYEYDCNDEELYFVRNYTISDFIKLSDKYIEANDPIFKSSIANLSLTKMRECPPDMNMHTFFKHIQMNTIASCKENFIIFNFMNKLARFSKSTTDDTGFVAKLQNLVTCIGSLTKKIE